MVLIKYLNLSNKLLSVALNEFAASNVCCHILLNKHKSECDKLHKDQLTLVGFSNVNEARDREVQGRGGRSENNIKCVVHDDLGWKNRTTRCNCRFSGASLALRVIFSVS